jgi:hypothetical protein
MPQVAAPSAVGLVGGGRADVRRRDWSGSGAGEILHTGGGVTRRKEGEGVSGPGEIATTNC